MKTKNFEQMAKDFIFCVRGAPADLVINSFDDCVKQLTITFKEIDKSARQEEREKLSTARRIGKLLRRK